MHRLKTETSRPRSSGGAASAMYTGTTIDETPTPKPSTSRPASSAPNPGAAAITSEPAAKSALASMMTGRRP